MITVNVLFENEELSFLQLDLICYALQRDAAIGPRRAVKDGYCK